MQSSLTYPHSDDIMFPTEIPHTKWHYGYPTLVAVPPVIKREIIIKIGQHEVIIPVDDIQKCQISDKLTGDLIGEVHIKQMDTLKTVTTKEITDTLLLSYPWLKSPKFENVLVAGDTLSTIIQALSMGQKVTINKLDFFMYKMDPSACYDKIVQLITTIKSIYPDSSLIRTQSAITLVTKDNKFQIHLKSFDSPLQILQSFDIHSYKIGIFGFLRNPIVITTTKGFFSLTNRINIVEPTKHNDNYPFRLSKSFDHGYSIVFPHLTIVHDKIILPYLTVDLKSVDGNHLSGNIISHEEAIMLYDYLDKSKCIDQFMTGNTHCAFKVEDFTTGEDALRKLAQLSVCNTSDFMKYVPKVYVNDTLDLKITEQIPDFDYSRFMRCRDQGPACVDSYLYLIYYKYKAFDHADSFLKTYGDFFKIVIEPYN